MKDNHTMKVIPLEPGLRDSLGVMEEKRKALKAEADAKFKEWQALTEQLDAAAKMRRELLNGAAGVKDSGESVELSDDGAYIVVREHVVGLYDHQQSLAPLYGQQQAALGNMQGGLLGSALGALRPPWL